MGKSMMLIGTASTGPVSAPTAEAAVEEYHISRKLNGSWTPRPQVELWSKDQRERFEREIARLERKDHDDAEGARALAVQRPIGPAQIP